MDNGKSEDNIENLNELSRQQVLDRISAGEPIENAKVEFLNFDGIVFKNDIIIRNCDVAGIVARGTKFQRLILDDCRFKERVELSARKKSKELVQTVFYGEVKIKGCLFEYTFILRNGEIRDKISFHGCQFKNSVRLDKSVFCDDVDFTGNSEIYFLSAFRSQFMKHLRFQDQMIRGTEKVSLDLNGISIGKTCTFKHCTVEQKWELKRAHLGENSDCCLIVDHCKISDIDFSESIFTKKVLFSRVVCQGNFAAERFKPGAGQKSGRPVRFEKDCIFEEVRFEKESSFYGTCFQSYARFTKCFFALGANFKQVEFADVSSFWDSQSEGAMDFKKAHFVGRANFGKVTLGNRSAFNGAIFEEEANFFRSRCLGDIFFSESYFRSGLVLLDNKIEGGLGMQEITIDGCLNISNSTIKNRFILTKSCLNGSFIAPALNIGTWASLIDCVISGEVNLGGLRVGTKISKEDKEKISNALEEKEKQEEVPGSLYATNAIFHKELSLSKAYIKGNLDLSGVNSYAEIDLTGAEIGFDVDFSKSYFRGMIRAGGVRIERYLSSHKSRYKEEISFNGMRCKEAHIVHSSFDGGFTMRNAKISGILMLNNSDVDGKADLFKCRFERIYFYHFLVDHFLIDYDALDKALASEQEGNYEQARVEYGILKQSFQKRNDYKYMDWAYFRYCRSRRRKRGGTWNPITNFVNFTDWLFLDLGFGYGTRPMNIALVALAIMLGFAGIFYHFPQGIQGSSGTLSSILFEDAFYLSLTAFTSMDYVNTGPRFDHWLKYWFSAEGLLGIFLTTLFVATISRKIIRM